MSADFPEVRQALDAAVVPAVRPVDLAELYRAALDRQSRVARRWRRLTAAVATLAAGILLFALLPKLDVTLNDHEFAVRWGTPTVPPPPPADPRIEELLDQQSRQLAALRAANTRSADLQDLIVTVARDVADRDAAQKTRLATLAVKLSDFETQTARQFDSAERTNTALYNVVFATNKTTRKD